MDLNRALDIKDKYFLLQTKQRLAKLTFAERADLAKNLKNEMKGHRFYPFRREMCPGGNNEVFVKENGESRSMINLSSNDYLNMTQHQGIIKASMEVLDRYGVGSGGVPLFAGTTDLHTKLEKALASFLGYPSSLLYNSGYAANYGVLTALIQSNDVAILDRLVHASIIDGCINKNKIYFKHNDPNDLESILKETSRTYCNQLVVVDGVYSMEGELAKLNEIISVCRKYSAWLMIDDAHGFGVVGDNGRGTQDHQKIRNKAEILTGSFGKGLIGVGGFVAASQEVINYFEFRSRPFIYSTSIPPNTVAGLLKEIEILQKDTSALDKLWANINFFKKNLQGRGLPLGEKSESAIIPVPIGDPILAMLITEQLYQNGILVNAVAFPVVPRNKSRLRLTVTAALEKEELDYASEQIAKALKDFEVNVEKN